MFYYRYQQDSFRTILTEKSVEPLEGNNVLTSEEDFDLKLYDVFVEYIIEDKIVKSRKKMKPVEAVENYLHEIKKEQAEAETEIDYRLSLIELGLL